MAKTIKVKVDVDSDQVTILNQDTLTLTQQVRELKKALQTVPEGTKEWTLIQQKYNETKDSLDRVNVKSKELFGTMSSLPGPIGAVSGQLDSTIGTLKTFSSIKLGDIKTQFVALGADLKDIGKKILDLTGITKVYEVAVAGASKVLKLFGVSANGAATAAKGFGVVIAGLMAATGLILLTTLIGVASEAYEYFAGKADRAAAAQKNLNDSIQRGNEAALTGEAAFIQREGELAIARLKAKGANAKAIYDEEQSFRRLTVASLERYYNEIKDKDSKEGQAALINLKKGKNDILVAEANFQADQLEKGKQAGAKKQQESDKEIAQRKADLEKIHENEVAAILSLLPEREQELRKIANDYRVKIQLAEKNKEDTTLLEIAMQEALRLKRAEFAAKDTEDFENNLKKRLDELDKENADKLEKESIALELRKAQGVIGEEQFQGELFQIKLKYSTSDIERQQAQIDFLEYGKGKQKEYADFVIKSNQAIADSWYALGDSTASIFRELANLFEEGSDAAKTFAVISVVINAATGISKIAANLGAQLSQYGVASAAATAAISEGTALLATPFTAPFGVALIAAGTANKALATKGALSAKLNAGLQIGAIAASSAVQIATITGAGKSSRPAGSSSSGGGSTDTATPAFSAPTQAAAPNIEKSNVSSEGKIGQIVTGAATQQGSRPLQTYVIGSQVSSQQELDRRISLSARMGG